jgi:hypothetical protein
LAEKPLKLLEAMISYELIELDPLFDKYSVELDEDKSKSNLN